MHCSIKVTNWLATAAMTITLAAARPAFAGSNCPADIAPPGGNSFVNVDDLLAVINGWGACGIPCPPYCNADVTHNCFVNVDDLLAVINSWGACPPCRPDSAEPNDSCSQYKTLATVGSNQTLTWNQSKLGTAGDVDVFRINASETDSTCSCCDFWCTEEDYKLTITLTVPASADASYEICAAYNLCTAMGGCKNVSPGTSDSIVFTFYGECPGMDSYAVYVRIKSLSTTAVDCAPYTLQCYFDTGCF